MAKYKVRLESPEFTKPDGSPHFRETNLVAETPEAAVALLERRERKKAAHELSPEVLAELEQVEADAQEQGVQVPGQVRAFLHTHRQTEPYHVVSVEEMI